LTHERTYNTRVAATHQTGVKLQRNAA
jgi:hypothetical protein